MVINGCLSTISKFQLYNKIQKTYKKMKKIYCLLMVAGLVTACAKDDGAGDMPQGKGKWHNCVNLVKNKKDVRAVRLVDEVIEHYTGL